MMYAARSLGFWPKLRLGDEEVRGVIIKSLPIGASLMLSIGGMKLPLFVLSGFCRDNDVGAYVGADMLTTAAVIVQGAVTGVTYPKLAASYGSDPAQFRRVFWSGNLLILAVGSIVAIVLAHAKKLASCRR